MRHRQTLVLTLIRDGDTPSADLHGSLKDVSTGIEVPFTTWEQLHQALENADPIAHRAGDSGEAGDESA